MMFDGGTYFSFAAAVGGPRSRDDADASKPQTSRARL
jgi:hypothetical protein